MKNIQFAFPNEVFSSILNEFTRICDCQAIAALVSFNGDGKKSKITYDIKVFYSSGCQVTIVSLFLGSIGFYAARGQIGVSSFLEK